MSKKLEQLAADIRAALRSDADDQSKKKVCEIVSAAVRDEQFVSEHLDSRADGDPIREVLYEDPELGFCICGHVFSEPNNANPHDHGPSWAIYGQAVGRTIMTDWTIVDAGGGNGPKRVAQAETYTLNPGDAHLYDVGAVHSLVRETAVKTLRIEGENLDRVSRSTVEVA